jgi:hypothetical protein
LLRTSKHDPKKGMKKATLPGGLFLDISIDVSGVQLYKLFLDVGKRTTASFRIYLSMPFGCCG